MYACHRCNSHSLHFKLFILSLVVNAKQKSCVRQFSSSKIFLKTTHKSPAKLQTTITRHSLFCILDPAYHHTVIVLIIPSTPLTAIPYHCNFQCCVISSEAAGKGQKHPTIQNLTALLSLSSTSTSSIQEHHQFWILCYQQQSYNDVLSEFHSKKQPYALKFFMIVNCLQTV